MVRAPGGQLITRIKTEVAAGKLSADVIDHSDRALMTPLVDLFQDYAPPNGNRLQSRRADLAEAVAARHAGLVDRLQHRAGQKSAEELDGSDQAGIRQDDLAGDRGFRRHHLDPHSVREAGARRGLLEKTGGDASDALSIGRADVGRHGARRNRDGSPALQRDLSRSRRTARRSRFSSRPKARRSILMPAASRRRRSIPTPPSCSSTGACRKKARPS